ncbi:MAG: hypothetical protein ACOCP8_00140 [archaeon]
MKNNIEILETQICVERLSSYDTDEVCKYKIKFKNEVFSITSIGQKMSYKELYINALEKYKIMQIERKTQKREQEIIQKIKSKLYKSETEKMLIKYYQDSN